MKVKDLVISLNDAIQNVIDGNNQYAIMNLIIIKNNISGKLDNIVKIIENVIKCIEKDDMETAYIDLVALSNSFTIEEQKKETNFDFQSEN